MKKSLLLLFSAIVLAGCTSEKSMPVSEQNDSEKLISEYEAKINEYESKLSEYEAIISLYESEENNSPVYANEGEEYSSNGEYGNATPEEMANTFIFKGLFGKDEYILANLDYSNEGTPEESIAWFEEDFEGISADDIIIEVFENEYSEYTADIKVNDSTKLVLYISNDPEIGWVVSDW